MSSMQFEAKFKLCEIYLRMLVISGLLTEEEIVTL